MSRNVPYHRAYTYKVIAPPQKLAVSLELFKQHLKKRASDDREDTLLSLYLSSATDYAEKFTRRDIMRRTYTTYRDFFPNYYNQEGYYRAGHIPNFHNLTDIQANLAFELRRSPLVSVEEIRYFIGGVLTILDPATYYNTLEEDYSKVLSVNDWPLDCDSRMQAIEIDFICGMADNQNQVPAGYVEAIMAHATAIRQNRGDCSANGCAKSLPAVSKSFYLQNRIENL